MQEVDSMGEKDITEKMLADYNDVFADIVNGLLFNGEEVVDENGLVNIKDKSQYKADGKIHEEERDVVKRYEKAQIQIAIFGLEHQTEEDKDEPFRIMGYDGAAYKSQLLDKENKQRYPVITLVLYFGTTHWKKPKSLHEALEIPEEFKKYVSDYKINVFEIAFLEPEQVKLFKSDFRIVADYFVQVRKSKDYVPSKDTIKHVDAVLKLMTVLTQDSRFEDVQKKAEKGSVVNMCEVMDKAEARGRAKAWDEIKDKLAEKDGQLAEKDGQLAEKDGQLAEKDVRIRELERQLAELRE
jgi:hypothetical protein